MYRHREFRMVETERLTVSEWTSEGSLERLLQLGLTGPHPLSIGARMMVRVSEWTFSQMSIWVVSQKFTLLSHVWGQRRFLVSGNILSKIFHHARGAKPKRIFFPDTFFTLLRQGRLIHLPSKTNIKIRIKNGENDYEKESEKII